MTELSIEQHDSECSLVGGSLVIEEARTYVLKHGSATEIWLSEQALRRTDDGWLLPIDSWAGAATLRVLVGTLEERIPVEVLPRGEKLDASVGRACCMTWSCGHRVSLRGSRAAA